MGLNSLVWSKYPHYFTFHRRKATCELRRNYWK